MFFWNSHAFSMIQQMLAIWPDSSAFSKTTLTIREFMVHVLLKPGLENFECYFISVWDDNCLTYCVGFCIASTWISYKYAYVPSLLNPAPTSHPTPPLEVGTEHWVRSLCHSANPHVLPLLRAVLDLSPCSSLFVPPSPSPAGSPSPFSASFFLFWSCK